MAFLVFCVTMTVMAAAMGTELVPERYLRPRDFNHHPFTDVVEGAVVKQSNVHADVHPYAILASKRPREGREFPEHEPVLYPNPPAAVLPRKSTLAFQLQPQPSYPQDAYNIIPKNYAFSYSVKDKHSGDDFSHSQAHNGKATRGQYRVKLPDGRVQVVSYTADHKGYRADVQYEGAAAQPFPHQKVTPVYEHTTTAPATYVHPEPQQYYTPTPAPFYQHESPYIQHQPPAYPQEQPYNPTPVPYQTQYVTPAPYHPEKTFSPTPDSYPDYVQEAYDGPDQVQYNAPFDTATTSPETAQNYASPSPITFPTAAPERQSYPQPSYPTESPGLQAYASPTVSNDLSPYGGPSTPEYESYASPSPSPFIVQPYLRSVPSPFARHQGVTSTENPSLEHILVTPRIQRNSKSANDVSSQVFGARQQIIYRLKSSSQ